MTHPSQHFLIYGDAGGGKTTGAATFPKPAIVFMFDPRGKETPYLKKGAVSPSAAPDGTPIQEVLHRRSGDLLFRIEHYIDSDPTKPAGYSRFLQRLTHLEEDIDALGVQTVIVDSVTFMELMARKLSQYKLNATSREPRQWFGASTDTLEEVLMIRLGSLAINVVVLAHIDDQKVSSHGTNVFSIAAPGRLSRRGPAAYSEVYRAYVQANEAGEKEWLWQTSQDAMYVASSQIGAPNGTLQDYNLLWVPE
jgi:AAA domain-containing protein